MRKILVVNSKGGCGKTTIATNLAVALANRGEDVALADADRQKSSLSWTKRRPADLAAIESLNWTKEEAIGDKDKKLDAIVIDGPGGLRSELAKNLIAEASDIIVPVLPSAFDWQATVKFLDGISDIKRVRKGKAEIYLIANRINRSSTQIAELEQTLAKKGYPVLCRISDRVAYAKHAANGSGIFDYKDGRSSEMRNQWHPLLQAVD
ncbi:chromosome partitioning protein [Roseibium hamelinense]|uniref:Chromosome partitioning protein n=1 Tax=Roseibium hamelinense TaxID=150831 RepID=A0A562TI03_9HYPH|nr:ParA family protein [Roseibium hamelinense]MTI45608.1 ParA family protein [Roseibium hamelinense]TWI93212.1 chromosome partitioning protein [Roseibium hamelinense]